jgi:hypothetical protein
MEDGKWKMANGRWQMEDGKWKMANGRWQMEDGRWKMPRVADARAIGHLPSAIFSIFHLPSSICHLPSRKTIPDSLSSPRSDPASPSANPKPSSAISVLPEMKIY